MGIFEFSLKQSFSRDQETNPLILLNVIGRHGACNLLMASHALQYVRRLLSMALNSALTTHTGLLLLILLSVFMHIQTIMQVQFLQNLPKGLKKSPPVTTESDITVTFSTGA